MHFLKKVNLWDLDRGRLLWSNSRSDARYKRSGLSRDRAVAAGSYDQEGYLQVRDKFEKYDNHNLLSDIKNYFNRVQSPDTQQMFKIPKVLIYTCFVKKNIFHLFFLSN